MPKEVPVWKKRLLDNLQEKFRASPVIASANLNKVRASQIHELRKKLRGRVEMTVTKKTLMKKAAEQVVKEKKNILEFLDALEGAPLLIFTKMDPYALVLLLDKSKVMVTAKDGDVATADIIIPSGNTGIPPGPVISEFGEVKVPTKIESGSIWVSKDTMVAQKGDVISSKLASVLSRLGMKPIEAGLTLSAAYEKGIILKKDVLEINLDEFKTNIEKATSHAFNLALNANIVLKETAPAILGRAHLDALTLAQEAGYLTTETVGIVLARAHINALKIQSKILKE